MKSSSSESDIGDYLSNLRKKTISNKSDFHIDGLSDYSLSDLSDKKDKSSKVKAKLNENKTSVIPNSKKINSKKQKKETKSKKTKQENKKKISELKHFSDEFSDSEINFSLPSTPRDKKRLKEKSNFVPKLQLGKKTNQIKSDDNDDSSFGKDGNRFLKRKPDPTVQPMNMNDNYDKVINKKVEVADELSSSGRDISSPRKSTLRSARSPSNKKKVTILENKQVDSLSSLDMEILNSYDENIRSRSDSLSDNDKTFCGLNIMSFNDLVADDDIDHSFVNNSLPKYGQTNKFEKIVSLEELQENYYHPKDETSDTNLIHYSVESNDSLSEIKSIHNFTPRKSSNLSRNQSISEVISISQIEQSDIMSTNSKIHSIELKELPKEKKRVSISVTKKSAGKSASYSSDFTDEDGTLRSITKHVSKKEIQIPTSQPDIGHFMNSSIESNQRIPFASRVDHFDPIPIAHYVVSPEALESLTAYSPSMLLMTNMFRQQIQMTTNFIETQQKLYDSLISSIKPSYQYTTLKETKEFIKLNKRKQQSIKEG